MTKKGALWFRIVIWSIVLVFFLSLFGLFLAGQMTLGGIFGGWNIGASGPVRLVSDETYSWDMDLISKIRVESAAGDVQIIPWNDSKMRVVYYSNESDTNTTELRVDKQADSISIKQDRIFRFGSIFSGNAKIRLEIYIPRDYEKDIDAEITAGQLDINSFTLNNLNIEQTAGTTSVDNVQAKLLEVHLTAGNFHLNDTSADRLGVEMTAGQLQANGKYSAMQVEMTAGNMNISNAVLPESLRCNMVAGNMRISIPEDEGFFLEYEKTAGSIGSDFSMTPSLSGSSGNAKYQNGGNTFNLKITAGSFYLAKR